MEPIRGREFLSNAIRYWEPRRILYNLVLAVIVVTWYKAYHSPKARCNSTHCCFCSRWRCWRTLRIAQPTFPMCLRKCPDCAIPGCDSDGVVRYRPGLRSRTGSLFLALDV